MRADRKRKGDKTEDERRERKRESLVVLDLERRAAIGIMAKFEDFFAQLAQGQVRLGLRDAGGSPDRAVHRQAEIVDAEARIAVTGWARGASGGPDLLGREVLRRIGGHHVGLVDRAVHQAERDAPIHLIGEQAAFPSGDDAREHRIALVRDQQTMERDLRGAHVLDIDDHVAEHPVEHALLQPADRPRLENAEQLPLELSVRQWGEDERERRGGQGDDERSHQNGTEEPQHVDPGGLERNDFEIAGQTATGEEYGHQEGHGQRVSEK